MRSCPPLPACLQDKLAVLSGPMAWAHALAILCTCLAHRLAGSAR